jgi:parallel beta-helix repeat protein
MSDGNIIGHNLLEYLPHHAINLGNNPWGRNIIEYNVIRHVCLEIMDTGAINSWMEQPASQDAERVGHVIRFNYIADVYGFQVKDGRVGRGDSELLNGIYLDNYTSNCLVYGNVVVRCRNGIQIHAGRNNVIENNIFVNCWANYFSIDAVTGGSPY